MSYVDINDKEIMEMDDEVLECEIRSEMNAYLNHRYQDARRDNLSRLLAESKRRDPAGMNYLDTKDVEVSCFAD